MTNDTYYELAEDLLREFVGFQTINPPGNELPLAVYIAEKMKGFGFKTRVMDLGGNRGNVIIDYGDSDNQLIFNGHLDVVPPGEGWYTDPFVLTEKDGRYFARGSCDMKAGTAAFLAAAIKAKDEGRVKDCMLRMVLVCDEEVNGIGSKAFAAEYEPAPKTMVIIGEPTEFGMKIAHRGVTRFRITIEGRQCHSGVPYQGINAIAMTAKLIDRIVEFDRSRQTMECGILDPPNMTCTMIEAGVKENVVPGTAVLTIDCRTVPGETPATLTEHLNDMLCELFDGTEVKYRIECFINISPAEIPADCRAVRLTDRAIFETTGEHGVIGVFGGSCDMPYLIEKGFTEAFCCGPGSMDQAHVQNEYVRIADLHKAVAIYSALIDIVQEE